MPGGLSAPLPAPAIDPSTVVRPSSLVRARSFVRASTRQVIPDFQPYLPTPSHSQSIRNKRPAEVAFYQQDLSDEQDESSHEDDGPLYGEVDMEENLYLHVNRVYIQLLAVLVALD
ncbi:unnamed protein product [Polarella glacialis]|uniref:Uncharacterized protein n=1 Tax=Polarella glacialis TaxID=89957 RepID=A0A813FMT8_POLGL|nr:unnamed protein product [Polarella glacialis]